MAKLSKYEEDFYALSWQDRQEWLRRATKKLDNAIFCPVCKHLLTGLHEQTSHFVRYIGKSAAKLWKEAQKNG